MKKLMTLLIFISLFSLFNLPAQKCLAEGTSKPKLNSVYVAKDAFRSNSIDDASQRNNSSNRSTVRQYILGANDIIDISFVGFPEFKQDNIRIQPDGKILISPVGYIQAQGLTVDELQQKLTDRFKTILKNPMISLNLVKTKSLIVYVTGAVLLPGSYELNTDTSLSNAYVSDLKTTIVERKAPLLTNVLVAAGGITPDADLENVEIENKYDNRRYKVNLLDLINKGDSSQDISLMSGDVVYVPKVASTLGIDLQKYNSFASSTFARKEIPVRVLGYVNQAGLVTLDPANSPRLNTAISKAGGYTSGSALPPKKVIISRMDNNGKFTSTEVNPMKDDVVLLPNDVVYVPEKLTSTYGRLFDYIFRVVNPISSAATGYSNVDYTFKRK